MVTRPVIVVGGGGHGRVVIEALRRAGRQVVGVVDPHPAIAASLPPGVAYLGGDEVLEHWDRGAVALANGIGAVGRPTLRRAAFERLRAAGFEFPAVIHPAAVVAEDIVLGSGVQVMAGAVVQPGCTVGDNTILNTRTSVDHDCLIGNHCHLAPGSLLSGAVSIGEESFVGAGATIIQGIDIGANVVIGAGTIVFKNIPNGAIVRSTTKMQMITVDE